MREVPVTIIERFEEFDLMLEAIVSVSKEIGNLECDGHTDEIFETYIEHETWSIANATKPAKFEFVVNELFEEGSLVREDMLERAHQTAIKEY